MGERRRGWDHMLVCKVVAKQGGCKHPGKLQALVALPERNQDPGIAEAMSSTAVGGDTDLMRPPGPT